MLLAPLSQRPLPGQRHDRIRKQEAAPPSRMFIENADHLFAEAFPESARVKAEHDGIKQSTHHALLGLAICKRVLPSRTTPSNLAISAVSTPRPSEFKR